MTNEAPRNPNAQLKSLPKELQESTGDTPTYITLEQQRLAYALECASSLPADYATAVKALPATILMAGLGQAIAMECTKEDARQKLADDVCRWLLVRAPGRPASAGGKASDHPRFLLLDWLTKCAQQDYVWAQAEALALLAWLKRCAVAKDKASGKPGVE